MPAAEGTVSPQPMSVDGENAISAAWMLESLQDIQVGPLLGCHMIDS